jgi:hypothetical protein
LCRRCSEHCDARRSPAYAAPAFGPRRLLFMVDMYSGALCVPGGGLDRAKLAMHALLDSTSEEDLVAVRDAAPAGDDGVLRARALCARRRQCARAEADRDDIEPVCGQAAANTTYSAALHRAFDELESTMRGTTGKVTSCQAALVFMTADAVRRRAS